MKKCTVCKRREAERDTRCFPCIVGDDTTYGRYDTTYGRYKVDVPEGASGVWRVAKFEVNADASEMDRVRALVHGHGRYVPPGVYTALYRGTMTIMSDTPNEILDHLGAVRTASGNVLVAGLGLGLVVRAMLGRLKDGEPAVTSLTVVEKSPDVIKLVGPVFADCARISIVEADIFTWKPPGKFDFGWFDIWDDLYADNLDAMATLNRKFARSIAKRGHWGRSECQRQRRQFAHLY